MIKSIDTDIIVIHILIHELGLIGASRYARRISNVPGGFYSAQYARIADELDIRIKTEYKNRLAVLKQISDLPGYHPVEGDLGTIPI